MHDQDEQPPHPIPEAARIERGIRHPLLEVRQVAHDALRGMEGKLAAEQLGAQRGVVLARKEQEGLGALGAGDEQEAFRDLFGMRQAVDGTDIAGGGIARGGGRALLAQMAREREKEQRERRQALLAVDDIDAPGGVAVVRGAVARILSFKGAGALALEQHHAREMRAAVAAGTQHIEPQLLALARGP